MRQIVLRTPAKINLALDVLGRREDGYHELDTIMQSVDIFDDITISIDEEPSIRIECSQKGLSGGAGNLAARAARAVLQAAGAERTGVRIGLVKRIPAQAGMGGGSADAAAVLVGLDRLLGLGLGTDRLCELGAQLGADVPFCVVGGTQRCGSAGERMAPLPPLPDCVLVLAKPAQGVPTAACFAQYDALAASGLAGAVRPDVGQLAAALQAQDLAGAARAAGNALQPAAGLRQIGQILRVMRTFGALGAAMTGSGSAVFGIFEDPAAAERCRVQLRRTHRWTVLARPVAHGPQER